MFKKKKKILFASEASFAHTGFGTIYKELITRIHASNKFRVAEFGTDSIVNDIRDQEIPWRFYPNSVSDDDPRHARYAAESGHGAWRFEKVLLDFEPDIVIDLRDPNQFEHEGYSSLRPFFHWCIGPTVDSAPRPEYEIDCFLRADSVMPYSKYGHEVLKKEHLEIKSYEGYGPGINLNVFKPLDKSKIRAKYSIDNNQKIIGYVSRNQIRKKFPELFKAFAEYLKQTGSYDTLLHCHTATPDIQHWNIPKLLIENNLQNNVLFTYFCLNCQETFIEKWQDFCTECKKCKKARAINPRTSYGSSQEVMCEIYNLYDMYIQYSNCEGLGVGVLEAAACGIPFMAVDYSAMQSLNDDLDGIRIPYDLNRDIIMDADRAIPNVSETVKLLIEHLEKPKEILCRKGMKTRKLCEQKYDWDKIGARWIDFLDNIELTGDQGQWGRLPTQKFSMRFDNNGELSDIRQTLLNIGRSDLLGSYIERDLYYRLRLDRASLPKNGMNKKQVLEYLKKIEIRSKKYMDINIGVEELQTEDFIRYADIKEVSGL